MTMLLTPPVLAQATSFWSLVNSSIRHSSAIENIILAFLVFCSILSWAIALWKFKGLRTARAGNASLDDALVGVDDPMALSARTGSMVPGPNVLIYQAAVRSIDSPAGASRGGTDVRTDRRTERVQLAMEHASRKEFTRLHRGMDILASIASATPFIGLFGTVLGIMATFQLLGTAKSASLSVVAPGIAAALIATAAGLAVAIPAVFLYNWLSARIDEFQEQSDMFIETLNHSLITAGVLPAPVSDSNANQVHHPRHDGTGPMIVGDGAHLPASGR